MSTEPIRGFEVRDWQGGTFDPSNPRLFSILPDCDSDEAYCVRHEREMPAAGVVLHHDGALYRTAADWAIYSCPDCCREAGPMSETLCRAYTSWAFETYDDPDVQLLDDAFRYVGEAGDAGVEPGVSVDD